MSDRVIRVLALSPIPEEGAGCRFRVSHFIPYLEQHGFQVTVLPFYTPAFFKLVYQSGNFVRKSAAFLRLVARRFGVLKELDQYDMVWLYREAIPIGPPVIERAIRRRGVPIVFDFDDAIFLRNVSEANRAVSFLKNTNRVAEIIRFSDHVTVGNSFLADYARQFSEEVTVVPTTVDTTRFTPRPDRDTVPPGGPVVGWIGSPTTYHYVEALAPLMKELAARHRFTLKISGAGKPVHFEGVNVVDAPWSMANEVELFNTCDIGVYPLEDDDWARGKCGFKAIQFMACGVPVVASAVGVNREIIRDGDNGFLASTRAEWAEKLERLLNDADLRRRFAIAGRQTIEARYSLHGAAPMVANILRKAAHRS